MPLHYVNLEPAVRERAVAELQDAIQEGRLYPPTTLTPEGAAMWPRLLSDALEQHSDTWLASQILPMLNAVQPSKTGPRKMPSDAHTKLAEGQFNTYYIHGVCRVAVERGIPEVEVYRAKPVSEPRDDAVLTPGARYDPAEVLRDLRANGYRSQFSPKPNTGISFRIPSR